MFNLLRIGGLVAKLFGKGNRAEEVPDEEYPPEEIRDEDVEDIGYLEDSNQQPVEADVEGSPEKGQTFNAPKNGYTPPRHSSGGYMQGRRRAGVPPQKPPANETPSKPEPLPEEQEQPRQQQRQQPQEKQHEQQKRQSQTNVNQRHGDGMNKKNKPEKIEEEFERQLQEEYQNSIDESVAEIKNRTLKWIVWQSATFFIFLPVLYSLGVAVYLKKTMEFFYSFGAYYQFFFTNWFTLLLIPALFIGPAKIGMTKRKMAVAMLMELAKQAGFNVDETRDPKKARIFKEILEESRLENRYYFLLGLMEKFWLLLGIYTLFLVITIYTGEFSGLWQGIASLSFGQILHLIIFYLGSIAIFAFILKYLLDYSMEEVRNAVSRAIARYETAMITSGDVTRGTQLEMA